MISRLMYDRASDRWAIFINLGMVPGWLWVRFTGVDKPVQVQGATFTYFDQTEVGYAVLGMTRKQARRAVWTRIEMFGMEKFYPRSLSV